MQTPLPIPGWLKDHARPQRSAPWLLRTAWLGAAAAVVLVGVWVVPHVAPLHEDRLTAKGANPSVAVYVKRGERVILWSGDVPLEAGDRIQLQIAPEGYRHVRVTTPDGAGGNQVLYEGDLDSTRPGFLPVSWKWDGAQSSEPLEITLTGTNRSIWTKRVTLSAHPGSQEVKP